MTFLLYQDLSEQAWSYAMYLPHNLIIKIVIFWNVMLYSLVDTFQCFKGTTCQHKCTKTDYLHC
jgi:hypothetical protein